MDIECIIDVINSPVEDAWIVSIKSRDIPKISLLLYALKLNKGSTVCFTGTKGRCVLLKRITGDSFDSGYVLQIGCEEVSVTGMWVDSFASLLVTTYLQGWSPASHIDYEFSINAKTLMLCFSVVLQ